MKNTIDNGFTAFTVEKASWILGVSRDTVSQGIRQGWIPTVRRHGRLMIPVKAIVCLLGGQPAIETVAGGGAR